MYKMRSILPDFHSHSLCNSQLVLSAEPVVVLLVEQLELFEAATEAIDVCFNVTGEFGGRVVAITFQVPEDSGKKMNIYMKMLP